MLLLIDVGNTRLKWALAQGNAIGHWVDSGALAHGDLARLATVLQQHPVERVLISHVAGAALRAELQQILEQIPRQIPDQMQQQTPRQIATPAAGTRDMTVQWFASVAECAGVRNAYRDPAQLGCDRFAAAIGARALFPGQALIVVGAGTATTIDALRADGTFLGGMILPGLSLMAASLAKGTAQLPRVDIGDAILPVFGDNTDDAIASGCLRAQSGAVAAALAAHRASTAGDVRCVISGGGGPLLQAYLSTPADSVEHLVLTGLHAVALQHEWPHQSPLQSPQQE